MVAGASTATTRVDRFLQHLQIVGKARYQFAAADQVEAARRDAEQVVEQPAAHVGRHPVRQPDHQVVLAEIRERGGEEDHQAEPHIGQQRAHVVTGEDVAHQLGRPPRHRQVGAGRDGGTAQRRGELDAALPQGAPQPEDVPVQFQRGDRSGSMRRAPCAPAPRGCPGRRGVGASLAVAVFTLTPRYSPPRRPPAALRAGRQSAAASDFLRDGGTVTPKTPGAVLPAGRICLR